MDLSAIDLAYAAVLVAVALYVTLRERLRLTVTSVMLASFWFLYGIGHFIFYMGADTDAVGFVRERVEHSLMLMWLALVIGIELARAAFASVTDRAEAITRSWTSVRIRAGPGPDQLLMALGFMLAAFYLGTFLVLGKPGQIMTFLSLETAGQRLHYRLDVAGQGGYLYHFTSMAIGPFLAVLLLMRARARRDRWLTLSALSLTTGLLAAKIGTLHKVPWLILLLQLAIAVAMTRKLDLSPGRVLGYAIAIVGGSFLAAYLSLPQYDIPRIFQFLFYRLFEVNNEVVYQTFYVYPDYIPHQWGMNVGLVHRLFGEGPLVSAHTHVANFFSAFGATFDPFFIGDAWVDLGYWGVFVIAACVGFIVKTLDVHVLALGKTPLTVALLVNGFYGVFQLQVTSAFTAMLSGGLLFVPLFVLGAMRSWALLAPGAGKRRASAVAPLAGGAGR